MKQIACSGIGVVLFLSLAGASAVAQSQPATPQGTTQSATDGQSLGDYARHVRRDNGPSNKPKVFDNDNLPKDDKLSVVGKKSEDGEPAAEEAPAEAESPAPGKPGETKAGEAAAPPKELPQDPTERAVAMKQWDDKLEGQKNQVDLLSRELDVLQREYQLRAAAMYADAGNRLRNQTGWDKQDADYKQQIADKQKALNDAKEQLGDMQEDARKAGVPSSNSEQQQ